MKNNIFLLLIFLFLILTCSSCSSKYHAKIYDFADDYFKPDFLENNKINGVCYGDGDPLEDETLPKNRTFIIKTFEEMDSMMINNDDLNINFDKQMLIVYTFISDVKEKLHIKNIKVSDSNLKIELNTYYLSFGRTNSCAFYQRIIIIKLDKLDFTNVEFDINQ